MNGDFDDALSIASRCLVYMLHQQAPQTAYISSTACCCWPTFFAVVAVAVFLDARRMHKRYLAIACINRMAIFVISLNIYLFLYRNIRSDYTYIIVCKSKTEISSLFSISIFSLYRNSRFDYTYIMLCKRKTEISSLFSISIFSLYRNLCFAFTYYHICIIKT